MEVPAQMGQQVRELAIARKDDGGPALEWVDDRAIEILMQLFFDDLVEMRPFLAIASAAFGTHLVGRIEDVGVHPAQGGPRSEERRGGKECVSTCRSRG